MKKSITIILSITIPLETNAGGSTLVSVRDANLADGKQVASIYYLDENDEIKLKNNELGYVSVGVYDNNDNQYNRERSLVGMFTSDDQEYTVSTEVQCPDGLEAGTYTGNMSFEIEITDA